MPLLGGRAGPNCGCWYGGWACGPGARVVAASCSCPGCAGAVAGAVKASRGPFCPLPRWITVPGWTAACWIRAPATKVPLVEPWSVNCQPAPSKLTVACRQETLASSNGKSDAGSRPMV
ncbi:hypothetical protein KCH_57400 [Kitasatospora cheerisanensis KCTC 2395]|uniref:Uncharacterized protein n=1 Tax=Kitasatospora cheerisanensis KCTC 2395 TaxID=1348663 RepID=A0A066YN35_9ACTN|nr:hypothetical protein KCH_57400 [Kitasatospora cheerisanensis KCTC 2395]